MRKKTFSEERIALALRDAQDRDTGDRGLPEDGGIRAILLPVEEEVPGDEDRLYLAAIPLSFAAPWCASAIYVLVALLWLVPDRRIERALAGQ